MPGYLCNWNILSNNALALLLRVKFKGLPYDLLLIYKYDINNMSIKIQYHYSEKYKRYIGIKFSGSKLPMIPSPKSDDVKPLYNEIFDDVIDDNICFAENQYMQ